MHRRESRGSRPKALATAGWEVIGVARLTPASFPGQHERFDCVDYAEFSAIMDLARWASGGCAIMMQETRLAIQNLAEETQLTARPVETPDGQSELLSDKIERKCVSIECVRIA